MGNKTVKTKILEFHKPTINGRVYTTSSIIEMKNPMFAYVFDGTGAGYPERIDDIVGVVKEITYNSSDQALYAEIEFLNVPKGPAAKDLCENHGYKFVTFGLGVLLSDNKTVDKFQLMGVSLVSPDGVAV